MISIGWGTIALFVAVLAFFYVLAGAGIVLPLVAIGLWRTGRRAPAVKLGLAGSVALVLSAGPHLWDRIAFERSVAALERAEITRKVPDLTGRVVAYVSSRHHDDISLECEAILRHSGAAQVYMIEPLDTPRGDGPAPDLSAPLDLAALVSAQAALSDIPPGFDDWPDRGADMRQFCAPAAIAPPLVRIDYFVMEGGYYDATAPFRDLLAGIDRDRFRVALGWYFAPVADPRNFRISAEGADLLRFDLSADLATYPWLPGMGDMRTWPGGSAWTDELEAILCRDAAKDCRVQ